jgi:photosystem II stability/assembly factor-like uncharacterized protein
MKRGRSRRGLPSALAAAAIAACGPRTVPPGPTPSGARLVAQASGTTALLQAVSAVNERVVWVGGHRATYARTIDGGATWESAQMPGVDTTIQFRDVHAVSADVAYLLAAGPGERSRIYKTTDGGRSWQLQFQNRDSAAFFDCFAFGDAEHGVAVSDAVGGRLIIIRTDDGGAHWERVPDDAIPAAHPGEGAFAASGTCVVAVGARAAWIGTGATDGARVYLTTDGGRRWEVALTPVVSGQFSGIASLAFRDTLHGVALGGRLGAPEEFSDNVAVTADGGRTWALAGRPNFSGAVYGGVYVPGARTPTLVAAGPKGLALSADEGRSWTTLSTDAYWSVGFASPRAGWAVGPGGRITRINLP